LSTGESLDQPEPGATPGSVAIRNAIRTAKRQ
jgi:hypothetical protein